MKDYFIKNINNGNFIFNSKDEPEPIDGKVSEIEFIDDGKKYFLGIHVGSECPNYYLSKKTLMKELKTKSDKLKVIEDNFIDEFDGVAFGDFDETFKSFIKNGDNPSRKLVSLLIKINELTNNEIVELRKKLINKYISEIQFDPSNREIEYNTPESKTDIYIDLDDIY
jgi:hypothetical protein